MDADDLGHDAADFGGSVELAFALATLGSKVPHQVFVGVSQNVVAVGSVLREVESLALEDGNQAGQPLGLFVAVAQFLVIEVRKVGLREHLVGFRQRFDDLGVDLVADVFGALQSNHVGEACPLRDFNRRSSRRHACVLVADVFDEQQREDVVLVLAGIHPATQLIAARPKG